MDDLGNAIWSVIPTLVIGGFFAILMWSLFTADRRTRRAYSRYEREERERLGLVEPPNTDDESEAQFEDEAEDDLEAAERRTGTGE